MRASSWIVLITLLAGGGALLVACGGGGGGVATPTSAFYGSYGMYVFQATAGPPDSCESLWGGVDADGLDGLAGWLDGNMDGTTGGSPLQGWSSRLESDSSLYWQHAGLPGTDIFGGSLRTDGRAGVLMPVQDGMTPAMIVLARRGGFTSAPALNGTYHACGFSYDLGAMGHTGWYGAMTFDGAGGGQRSFRQNREGTLGLTIMPVAITYVLSPSGNLSIDATTFGSFHGDVYADSEFVMVGGSTENGEDPMVLAMVEPSTTASVAIFSGTYALVGVGYGVVGSAFTSVVGSAVADGSGALTVTLGQNTEGLVTPLPPSLASYSVSPDGRLAVTTSGGEVFRGGVSPTGDYVVIGGSDVPGTDPGFYVLVRR